MYKRLRKFGKTCFNSEFGNAAVEYVLILSVITAIVFSLATIGLKLIDQFITSNCRINCIMTETQYNSYLNQIGVNHSDSLLEQFIRTSGSDICPEYNRVTYVDGKLQCSGHFGDKTGSSGENNSGGVVPFL